MHQLWSVVRLGALGSAVLLAFVAPVAAGESEAVPLGPANSPVAALNQPAVLSEGGAAAAPSPGQPKPFEESESAVPLPAHRKVWLEARSAAVSGNRGWAERIHAGSYSGMLPTSADEAITLQLEGDLQGCLHISDGHCSLSNP